MDGDMNQQNMAKGKVKNNDGRLAPPQPQPVRSRKREHPSDEISKTKDVQATLNHQDIERNSAVDATLPQDQRFLIQESTMNSATTHQEAEEPSFTEQNVVTEEKHEEAADVSSKIETSESQLVLINPNNDAQLEGFIVHPDNDANQSKECKEGILVMECNRPLSQTSTNQLQILLPTFKGVNASSTLEEQQGTEENSERHQEDGHKECGDLSVVEVVKEAEVKVPAKKKQRMGVCCLTGKERNRFLQTQKGENGESRQEKTDQHNCSSSADLMSEEEIIPLPSSPLSASIPAGSVPVQNKVEVQLQPSPCEGDYRAEAEIHSAATTSNGTSVLCDLGCSKGQSWEAEEVITPGPQQTDDPKSGPNTEEKLLGKQDQQEQQIRDGGDGSVVVDQSPAISLNSSPLPNKETKTCDAIEATLLQVTSVTRTNDTEKEEVTCDAETSASATDTQSGHSFDPVEPCGTAPSGSEGKERCHRDDESSAGVFECHHIRNTTDLLGLEGLDYLSDSQLNTITVTEEEVMEMEEDACCPDYLDASTLISGLIGELSSLNHLLMATQRELENLHQCNASSTSPMC